MQFGESQWKVWTSYIYLYILPYEILFKKQLTNHLYSIAPRSGVGGKKTTIADLHTFDTHLNLTHAAQY